MSVPYITLAAPYTPLENAAFVIGNGTLAKTRTYTSGSQQGNTIAYAACSLPINVPVQRPNSSENMLNAYPVKMGCYEDANYYNLCCVTLTTPGQDSYSSYGYYGVEVSSASTSDPSLKTNFMSTFKTVNQVRVAWNIFTKAYKTQGTRTYIETPNGELTVYSSENEMIAAMLDGNWSPYQPTPPDTDPYAPGGTSSGGTLPSGGQPGTGVGGDGSYGGNTDPASTDVTTNIDFPPMPPSTAQATAAGFITIFNPSQSELRALATYMWDSSLFDLSTWQKVFADPMECILGLSLVPVSIPSGGTDTVKVGNISTSVSMTKAGAQFIDVQCGAITFTEYWKAYLDFNPWTKVEIYLPYVGIHALNVDDIMGKSVEVRYRVDILTGACCAYVKCGDSVLYTYAGQCATIIPVTGTNMANAITGAATVAANIGTMIAQGGISSLSTASSTISTIANSGKTTVERSGAMSGTAGLMGYQKPYIILTRPKQCLPEKQNSFIGYPSFFTANIGDVVGYTEIESVHLENIPATDTEMSEIEMLLKGGVIL